MMNGHTYFEYDASERAALHNSDEMAIECRFILNAVKQQKSICDHASLSWQQMDGDVMVMALVGDGLSLFGILLRQYLRLLIL